MNMSARGLVRHMHEWVIYVRSILGNCGRFRSDGSNAVCLLCNIVLQREGVTQGTKRQSRWAERGGHADPNRPPSGCI